MKKFFVAFLFVTFIISGCAATKETVRENKKTTVGAIAGAAVGAGVGYAIGKDAKGAAIGSAVGALTGGSIGYAMDKQEKELRKALAASEAASIERQLETIIVSFKSDALFDFDSAVVKPGAYTEIDRAAEIISRYPQTAIRIEGHTDSVGTETYNLKLSEQRAMAVKNMLVAKGVAPSRIQIIGFGESRPLADNNTEAGRQKNRRVSIVITQAQA